MRPVVALVAGVLLTVAIAVAVFPAGADARHQQVLCGNFSGLGMDPHLARKPGRCEITAFSGGIPAVVIKLRRMHWTRWGTRAVGRGLANGKEHRIRLKEPRPCGINGQSKVYSKMSIDRRPFRKVLYCGD